MNSNGSSNIDIYNLILIYMKTLLSWYLVLIPFLGMAQWNDNGNNATSGNLLVGGSITSTTNYGLIIAPASGDAVLRRGNPGSLMISSNGVESDVRINYNYGGGAGGLKVYDGGTTNYGSLSVNQSGHFSVLSSGGNVGIGTLLPTEILHVSGAGDVEQLIEATDNGYASLTLLSNNKRWHWSKRPGNEQDALGLYHHDGVSWRSAFMTVLPNGNIGIGTTGPDAKLAVKGHIHTQEVRVDLDGSMVPDYVFEKDYELLPLSELEKFIVENGHLPGVPSAKEMGEDGLKLKEMNLTLLKKVEELTLHLIAQNRVNEEQRKINEAIMKELEILKR